LCVVAACSGDGLWDGDCLRWFTVTLGYNFWWCWWPSIRRGLYYKTNEDGLCEDWAW